MRLEARLAAPAGARRRPARDTRGRATVASAARCFVHKGDGSTMESMPLGARASRSRGTRPRSGCTRTRGLAAAAAAPARRAPRGRAPRALRGRGLRWHAQLVVHGRALG